MVETASGELVDVFGVPHMEGVEDGQAVAWDVRPADSNDFTARQGSRRKPQSRSG
jgi:hypothetical protein